MGIYIQGVDMPKQDELLQIRIYDDGKVSRIYDIKCQQIGTAIETPSDAVPQLKQTDTLIIADALQYLAKDTERYLSDRTRSDVLREQFLKYGARMKGGGDK
mgnify:CR=1 FL=1